MKLFIASFSGILLIATAVTKLSGVTAFSGNASAVSATSPVAITAGTTGWNADATVSDVVAKADAFKALLTNAQVTTLQPGFTTALSRRWSNLPCGAMCRNGLQFSTLNTAQLDAAKAVIRAASGTAANEGYDEFLQILSADSLLGTVNSMGYGKGIYFIAFLNAPSTTGAWMLQFGGHHYAANIAFNNGNVTGTTPAFEGVEPRVIPVAGGGVVAPQNQERAGMITMLASLSTAQLASARLGNTFSDVLLGPNQDGNFPATKLGLAVGTLSDAQKSLVADAMRPWLSDADDASGATLLSVYRNELDATYIAYGSNTSAVAGDSGTFLRANTDYVRIDGPSVWIEFVCQNGVVYTGIHYHTIYRDHTRDYGNYLARTTLPLRLLNSDVKVLTAARTVTWITADESDVAYYEIESSAGASGGFAALGRVPAKNGPSNTYSFTDKTVMAGNIMFYRIKMVDKDGYSRYSDIMNAKTISVPNSISLYPNPAKNTLSILLGETVVNGTVRVTNAAGSTVVMLKNQTGKKLDVNIAALPEGSYQAQVAAQNVQWSANFMKH